MHFLYYFFAFLHPIYLKTVPHLIKLGDTSNLRSVWLDNCLLFLYQFTFLMTFSLTPAFGSNSCEIWLFLESVCWVFHTLSSRPSGYSITLHNLCFGHLIPVPTKDIYRFKSLSKSLEVQVSFYFRQFTLLPFSSH